MGSQEGQNISPSDNDPYFAKSKAWYFCPPVPNLPTLSPELGCLERRKGNQYADWDLEVLGNGIITKEDVVLHKPWMGPMEMDLACLGTGNVCVTQCHPVPTPGVSNKAAAMYYAGIALIDNTMHALDPIDCMNTPICGKTLYEWMEQEYFSKDCPYEGKAGKLKVLIDCMKGMESVVKRRRFDGQVLMKQIYAKGDMEEYYRVRSADGNFDGALYSCLLCSGVDPDTIPPNIFWEAVKVGLTAWDIHSQHRHNTEGECSNTVLFFAYKHKVSTYEAVSSLLQYIKIVYNHIIGCEEISIKARASMTRWIMGLTTIIYQGRRYKNQTGVHPKPEAIPSVGELWHHVPLVERNLVPKLSDILKPNGCRIGNGTHLVTLKPPTPIKGEKNGTIEGHKRVEGVRGRNYNLSASGGQWV